jgi:hypothetical protein
MRVIASETVAALQEPDLPFRMKQRRRAASLDICRCLKTLFSWVGVNVADDPPLYPRSYRR